MESDNPNSVFEIEFKVELDAQQKQLFEKNVIRKGLTDSGVTEQRDFYTKAEKSKHYEIGGQYNVVRYRDDGGRYFYTEKTWQLIDNNELVRREKEHEIDKHTFETAIGKYPDSLKIQKSRQWYKGTKGSRDFTVTIDTVKFDHAINVRYFLEAELCVSNKDQTKQARNVVQEYLKYLLDTGHLSKAEGMFRMAFEKL